MKHRTGRVIVRGGVIVLLALAVSRPSLAGTPDEPMNLRCVGERVSSIIRQPDKKTPFSQTYSINLQTHQFCISKNCEAYVVSGEGVLHPLSNRPPPLDVCGGFHELSIDLEKLSLRDKSGGCGGVDTVTAVCRRIDKRELDKEAEIRRSNTVTTITANGALSSFAGPPGNDPAGAMKSGEFLVNVDGIKAVFENITQGGVTIIRHKPSGLLCVRPWALQIPKEQTAEFDPEKPTGCVSVESGVQNNLIVIPNGNLLPAGKALVALMAYERERHPILTIKTSADAESRSDRAAGSLGSDTQYMHLAVAAVKGWIVLDETIGAHDKGADCDRIAEAHLKTAIATIHER
jgi:hypothetical protein